MKVDLTQGEIFKIRHAMEQRYLRWNQMACDRTATEHAKRAAGQVATDYWITLRSLAHKLDFRISERVQHIHRHSIAVRKLESNNET